MKVEELQKAFYVRSILSGTDFMITIAIILELNKINSLLWKKKRFLQTNSLQK